MFGVFVFNFPYFRYMYWADWSVNQRGIWRAGLDGTNRVDVVQGLRAKSLTIDYGPRILYWINKDDQEIQTMDIESSSISTLNLARNPFCLTLLNDYIYWAGKLMPQMI